MEPIGSILRRKMAVIEALHIAQQKVQDINIDVTVLLAMIQLSILEDDEHDLAKWMSFYMLKKLEKEAGPDLWNQMKEEAAGMTSDQIRHAAENALGKISKQREELLTKIHEERKKNNG